MSNAQKKKLKSGEIVALTELPPGFIDDLPVEDQQAITEIVGRPIVFNGYDEIGRAELQFTSRDGNLHFIFINPKFITAAN
ncbi:MAG TPA: hypothetical protein VKR82_03910 [Candidatus Acidoferrales bacterium]|nr:hypothetical protein [Candidatus Acidoferrales bacterium]